MSGSISEDVLKRAIAAVDRDGSKSINNQAELDAFYSFLEKEVGSAVYHGKSKETGVGESVYRIKKDAFFGDGSKLEAAGYQGDITKGDFKKLFANGNGFDISFDKLKAKLTGTTATVVKNAQKVTVDADATNNASRTEKNKDKDKDKDKILTAAEAITQINAAKLDQASTKIVTDAFAKSPMTATQLEDAIKAEKTRSLNASEDKRKIVDKRTVSQMPKDFLANAAKDGSFDKKDLATYLYGIKVIDESDYNVLMANDGKNEGAAVNAVFEKINRAIMNDGKIAESGRQKLTSWIGLMVKDLDSGASPKARSYQEKIQANASSKKNDVEEVFNSKSKVTVDENAYFTFEDFSNKLFHAIGGKADASGNYTVTEDNFKNAKLVEGSYEKVVETQVTNQEAAENKTASQMAEQIDEDSE